MADSDWTSVISRREKKRNRDDELREERLRTEAALRPFRTRDLAWHQATHAPTACTDDEYGRNHARIWGAEEGMVDGKHRLAKPTYPVGSARDMAHSSYSESKGQMKRAGRSYKNAHEHHITDNKRLTQDELSYYKHASADLLPIQHADLSDRALDLADAA